MLLYHLIYSCIMQSPLGCETISLDHIISSHHLLFFPLLHFDSSLFHKLSLSLTMAVSSTLWLEEWRRGLKELKAKTVNKLNKALEDLEKEVKLFQLTSCWTLQHFGRVINCLMKSHWRSWLFSPYFYDVMKRLKDHRTLLISILMHSNTV